MSYGKGNKTDGKHYWITPEPLMQAIKDEFGIDFDPCPYPKPDDFDGLHTEWGSNSYVNPPFGAYIDGEGKRHGPLAWARKAVTEYRKGKRVIFIYPINRVVLTLIEAGAQVRRLPDVHWCAIEDGTPGPGNFGFTALFILDSEVEP